MDVTRMHITSGRVCSLYDPYSEVQTKITTYFKSPVLSEMEKPHFSKPGCEPGSQGSHDSTTEAESSCKQMHGQPVLVDIEASNKGGIQQIKRQNATPVTANHILCFLEKE